MGLWSKVKRTASRTYSGIDSTVAFGRLPGGVTRSQASDLNEMALRHVAGSAGIDPDSRLADWYVGLNRIGSAQTGKGGNPSVSDVADKFKDEYIPDATEAAAKAAAAAAEALAETLAKALEGAGKGLMAGIGPTLLVAGAGIAAVYLLKEKIT